MGDAGELEKVYRAEVTWIRAALAARLGDVGLAEELVQDAFVEALEHWQAEGLPASPGGWLATTAWRSGCRGRGRLCGRPAPACACPGPRSARRPAR